MHCGEHLNVGKHHTPDLAPRFLERFGSHMKKQERYEFLILLLTVMTFAGCSNGGDAPQQVRPDTAAAASSAPDAGLSARTASAVGPPYDLKLGKSVFSNNCLACHGTGFKGAPELGNVADWSPRLEQDLDTLIAHALKGHGRMPPKGGFTELSDSQVAAAVAYVVKKSQRLVRAARKKEPITDCHPINNALACNEEQLRDALVLQMMWLLRGAEDGS